MIKYHLSTMRFYTDFISKYFIRFISKSFKLNMYMVEEDINICRNRYINILFSMQLKEKKLKNIMFTITFFGFITFYYYYFNRQNFNKLSM